MIPENTNLEKWKGKTKYVTFSPYIGMSDMKKETNYKFPGMWHKDYNGNWRAMNLAGKKFERLLISVTIME